MADAPPEPKLSATILLVRDRAQILEVLMVKRHYQIDFASGALVFPGGKANDEDALPAWSEHCDGAFDPMQSAARVAAVREAFEESGVLLARPRARRGQGAPMADNDIVAKLSPMRAAIDKREASFLDLIRQHDLVLALDTLVHFGHWITPVMMPKRFDTHFYIAPAPEGQIAESDGRETTDAVWLGADKALTMEATGEATIIFPTRMNLIKLGQAKSVADACQRFAASPVVTVLPQPGKDETGASCLFIPESAGYGVTKELLSRVGV
jgi:8-oxo-dGTP pyrophosphatase MutT (NUDIX family)